MPVRVEGFARGGGEITPRAKEKEQTRKERKGGERKNGNKGKAYT